MNIAQNLSIDIEMSNRHPTPAGISPEKISHHLLNFELPDYLDLNQWFEGDTASVTHGSSNQDLILPMPNIVGSGKNGSQAEVSSPSNMGRRSRTRNSVLARVAFRIKTEKDILDDGFKWKKYGKKMVKNKPYPRNYFRCSVEGCPVKKRIERDADDPRHVITTYEGTHNHESPFS
uniref:WRKY domain-containing protein n=1 Tax=Nelumbo nucifera TaxID=4432 RepID=A0A822ZVN4_NELNU|nr:TPA_asm: hypothetical protein HUJ06_019000 [Nelumbo nucifera]